MKVREYRVNRFASVATDNGPTWFAINEVTGVRNSAVTYPSYDATKSGAAEVGSHYSNVERKAGW